jgi:hypothetical protein
MMTSYTKLAQHLKGEKIVCVMFDDVPPILGRKDNDKS